MAFTRFPNLKWELSIQVLPLSSPSSEKENNETHTLEKKEEKRHFRHMVIEGVSHWIEQNLMGGVSIACYVAFTDWAFKSWFYNRF